MLRSVVLLSTAVVAGALLSASPAAAFCRSTTCNPSKGTCPRDADKCKTTGAKLFWPGVCVGFSFQRDGTVNIPVADMRTAIEDAFAAWVDVPCGEGIASIAFSELPDVSCHEADYDEGKPNANAIIFQDTKWTYAGVDNNLAKTTVSYDVETGEIFDADIEINHAYNEFTVADDNVVYDLRAVVTHEVGHFIGLDHSAERDATMFAGYDRGTTDIRTITDDDIAGICAVYPPGRAGTCDPEPKNGLGDLCSGDADGALSGCACSSTPGGYGGERAGPSGAPLLAVLALGFLSLSSRRKLREEVS